MDDETRERLIERGARAIARRRGWSAFWSVLKPEVRDECLWDAAAVIDALGIKPVAAINGYGSLVPVVDWERWPAPTRPPRGPGEVWSPVFSFGCLRESST